VAIAAMIEQGVWTTGKQKGGAISASAALKEAVATEAAAHGLSKAKAKRVVEKAAALVEPKSKAKIDTVIAAAKRSALEVVRAMTDLSITKELDILRHVEPKPETDVVLRIVKAIGKVEGADYKRLVSEIVNHAIVDDILTEASKTTAAERDAARKAQAQAVSNAAAKAAEARKAKAEKPKAEKAKAVPKMKDSKRKAKTVAPVTDPEFA
jgi:ribosomal protein L12E/L44/L45/RPP1/RPP2